MSNGRQTMGSLLRLSSAIDRFNARIGRMASWLILASILISAGNAIIRKVFGISSNAWLEIQWWLFAAAFLFAAPWTLAIGEHIRIDIVNDRLSKSARDRIDLVGHLAFLLPTAILILVTSAAYFMTSWSQNEQALNPGGLPQWPVKAVIPAAAALLLLQGVSQAIKRVSVMKKQSGEQSQP
jgi:TRAP-type mannitol/chloroaromatic compound transport system permease small subunit